MFFQTGKIHYLCVRKNLHIASKMKQLLLFVLILSALRLPLKVEPVYNATASACSISKLVSDKEWGDWSEDMPCEIDVSISRDTVKVMSARPQIYSLLKVREPVFKQDGTVEIRAKAVDQDGDRCGLHFIHEPSDTWLLYVEYANVKWIYTISRRHRPL